MESIMKCILIIFNQPNSKYDNSKSKMFWILNDFTDNQKIVDILGRDTHFKKNKVLFYIYQDGTVRRHIVIE